MSDSVSPEPQGGSAPEHGSDDTALWEMRFYQDILARAPNYVEVLMLLGNLYTGNRMYAEGLQVDKRLASLRKDDPIVHYNLACSYSLMNRHDESITALRRAVELGYGDEEHLEHDSDLDGLRSDPRYVEVVSEIRRRKGARRKERGS
jgi:tetratricopeptide (TPR) repeat protein